MSSGQPLASKFTIISIQGIILLIIIVVLVISIFLYGFLIFLKFFAPPYTSPDLEQNLLSDWSMVPLLYTWVVYGQVWI